MPPLCSHTTKQYLKQYFQDTNRLKKLSNQQTPQTFRARWKTLTKRFSLKPAKSLFTQKISSAPINRSSKQALIKTSHLSPNRIPSFQDLRSLQEKIKSKMKLKKLGLKHNLLKNWSEKFCHWQNTNAASFCSYVQSYPSWTTTRKLASFHKKPLCLPKKSFNSRTIWQRRKSALKKINKKSQWNKKVFWTNIDRQPRIRTTTHTCLIARDRLPPEFEDWKMMRQTLSQSEQTRSRLNEYTLSV